MTSQDHDLSGFFLLSSAANKPQDQDQTWQNQHHDFLGLTCFLYISQNYIFFKLEILVAWTGTRPAFAEHLRQDYDVRKTSQDHATFSSTFCPGGRRRTATEFDSTRRYTCVVWRPARTRRPGTCWFLPGSRPSERRPPTWCTAAKTHPATRGQDGVTE